jgi:hypothetical protein
VVVLCHLESGGSLLLRILQLLLLRLELCSCQHKELVMQAGSACTAQLMTASFSSPPHVAKSE